MSPERPLVGILVGGRASRMGGIAKGLLPTPSGETIVGRLIRIVSECDLQCILVGNRPDYDGLGVSRIEDPLETLAIGERSTRGPLAGLLALLEAAHGHDIIALACDLPAVPRSLIERLAVHRTSCAVRTDGRWQPLIARYRADAIAEVRRRLVSGDRALWKVLDAIGAEALPISNDEAKSIADCDSPGDLR